MTKWALVFIVLMFATGNSFPIYFTDQIFRSLDQLDEALADGEISQEYYNETIDTLSTMFGESSRFMDVSRIAVPNQGEGGSFSTWKYAVAYRQELESQYSSTRFDRVMFSSAHYRGGFVTEQKTGHPYLLRSLSILVERRRLRIRFGELAPQYAGGLTVGRSEYRRELHSIGKFGSSVIFPSQHRKNGLSLENELSRTKISAYASRLEGDRFYSQSVGGDFTMTEGWADYGLVVLHQQLGEFGAKSRKLTFLAPHFRKSNSAQSFTTESSFQLNGAAAHLMQCEFRAKKLSQSFILFSYAKMYQNLESGGYAYSDYDDATLDDVGLEYREKRAGRRGVAIEQTLNFHPEKFSAQLVRWENRLDDRQCVAARLTFEQSNRFRILRELRLQAIYQDLDIEHGTNTRKLVTVSTELQASGSFTYENQHKIEQRILAGSRKYPFRSRHDFSWRINSNFESTAMINYYNSDLSSEGNDQLTLALEQKLQTGGDFRFSGRLQTRYRFATEKLDNWEFRINLEVVL